MSAAGYRSRMNGIETPSSASELVEAARSTVDVIDIGTLTDAVADTAGDIGDVATVVTKTGGRLVVRTVRAGGRLVRRQPKRTLGTVALLIAMIAAASWIAQRRTADEPTTELKAAA